MVSEVLLHVVSGDFSEAVDVLISDGIEEGLPLRVVVEVHDHEVFVFVDLVQRDSVGFDIRESRVDSVLELPPSGNSKSVFFLFSQRFRVTGLQDS